MPSPAVEYARQNHPRFLHELKALLRIPSVSTLPEHKGDCHFAAEVLAADLSKIGMENVRLIETGEDRGADIHWFMRTGFNAAGKPTVLVYGTTMCSRPIRWTSGFRRRLSRRSATEPLCARRGGRQGQVIAQVKALESLLAATGKLPLNVRVLFEGEEEVAGRGLRVTLRRSLRT